jgi:hypothetical protein
MRYIVSHSLQERSSFGSGTRSGGAAGAVVVYVLMPVARMIPRGAFVASLCSPLPVFLRADLGVMAQAQQGEFGV